MTQDKKQRNIGLRKARVRSQVSGTAARPRVSVRTSLRGMYVQLIDDAAGKTLFGARDTNISKNGSKTERAVALGKHVAEQAKAAGITAAVFDRGSKRYHGRVKALADAMREGGLTI